MFCVYNGAPRDASSARQGYGLASFPHQLCTDIVLCCAGLEPTTMELDLDAAQALHFAALRLTNARLRLWLCVGGDEPRSRVFFRAAEDAEARRRLVNAAIGWLQESGFQGLFLHWAPPGPRRPRQLVRILAPLKVVERYARAADELSHEACYLVTLCGTSLALEDRDQWDLGDPARGPGTLGNGTQSGLAALDEVCKLQWVGSKVSEI
ncbi:hypothetical protein V5799_003936 [Amblyomma americanum]|uniref:GH18 domain-containing protein n=1 Tax=Amblyomma americanum TaxID=6943 RepID=A0AAQ4D7I5_AMBAM